MKGGEGSTCVLLKGIEKMLGWGFTFTPKVGVDRGHHWVVCGLLKWYWGVGGCCVICIGWGVENGFVVVCENEN